MKLLRLLPCLLAISLFGADPKKPDYDSQYVLGPDSQEALPDADELQLHEGKQE